MPIYRNDKFLIVKNIKSFILGLENIINTFPKRDIITRNMVYNETLNLLEIVIKANYEDDKVLKHQYQIEALAKISKLDFFMERAYKLRYINEKQCILKTNELLKISKMIFSWCHNER